MHVQNTVLYFWEKLSNAITKFNSCPRDQYSLYASRIYHGYRHSVVALVVLTLITCFWIRHIFITVRRELETVH